MLTRTLIYAIALILALLVIGAYCACVLSGRIAQTEEDYLGIRRS